MKQHKQVANQHMKLSLNLTDNQGNTNNKTFFTHCIGKIFKQLVNIECG